MKGGFNGGGVVGEVIIDMDVIDDSTKFHAAFDILKGRQSLDGDLGGDSCVIGSGNGRDCIGDIVVAAQFPYDIAEMGGVFEYPEMTAILGK